MAVTLPESAKLSQDELQRSVVEMFVLESSVLDRIPLLSVEGNNYAYNEEATLPGVKFRDANEAFGDETGTVNQRTEKLVILGGDADVDRFIVQTRGNLMDQRAIQTRLKVKAATLAFQDAFINGDTAVNAKSFDGLKKRLTGPQVITAAPNGMPIIGGSANEQHAFFDKLDEVVNAVVGDVGALYMNKAIRAKIMSAGRRTGGTDWITVLFGDNPTMSKRIPTYNGIPMLDIGTRADGSSIIGLNETQGTASNASSIYAVSWAGDESNPGVAGLTNGGVQVRDLGEIAEKPVYRTRIEFYCGLGVFGKGAARLAGVLNN
ncbi:major capsid protein [Spirillospora sp. NPDC048911]|uniref:major capsid protein n=1 Tax=Spirillospora sp. NPDC048911 TaxID=3364527 RepID=UPI003718B2F3